MMVVSVKSFPLLLLTSISKICLYYDACEADGGICLTGYHQINCVSNPGDQAAVHNHEI